jgi:hypothetical protein
MNGYEVTIREHGARYLWAIHDRPNPCALADDEADTPEEAMRAALDWCRRHPAVD